jgi:DNA-binding GntR family transcriptional regulator
MAVTRHPPLREQVASAIRRAIVNLEFTPGQLLVERELCEMTEASRSSVREALRQLEAEGLLESHNGKGIYIKVLSPPEAAQVYEVRAELEGLAARLFHERATDDDRARLQTATSNLAVAVQQASDSRSILKAQEEFYRCLFEGARNPFLDRTVQTVQVLVTQLRAHTLTVPGRAQASLREFQTIAREMVEGTPETARQAAVDHVRHAATVMASARETSAVQPDRRTRTSG